jgi:hypothetical protein
MLLCCVLWFCKHPVELFEALFFRDSVLIAVVSWVWILGAVAGVITICSWWMG